MKKRFVAFLTVLCLVVALSVTAFAVQESKTIVWTRQEPGKLSVLLAAQTEKGEYEATLDGQSLSISVSSIQANELPITVYCLVDTSGYVSDFRMRLIQGTLTQISQSLTEHDNMVITTLENSADEEKILATEQERADAIAAITASSQDAGLYSGIVNSVSRLTSATDLNPVRALVILSSGVDRSKSGFTEQEVRDSIEKTRLPIFTVAIVESFDAMESGKLLGSFARSSCGGTCQSTVSEDANSTIRWGATGQEFGAGIWRTLSSFRFLTADLSQMSLDASEIDSRLTITYTTENNSFTDSVMVPIAELLPAPEPTEESVPADDLETTTLDRIASVPVYVWGAAGVVLLIIIITISVSISKRKKAQQKAMEEARRREEEDELARMKAAEKEAAAQKAEEMEPLAPSAPSKPRPACYLIMTDIPHGDHSCRFVVPLGEAVSFGRDNRSKYVLDGGDAQLSGLHFSVIVQDQTIRVRDEHSTNGTFINGVSIVGSGWNKMSSGDKLRVGSREYRVSISIEDSAR